MDQFRGILCLNGAPFRAAQKHKYPVQRLVFNENEPLLYQAQAALWEIRRQCGWVCVAAEGCAVFTALALAAQLPVDRLALLGGWTEASCSRETMRLRSYAMRNVSLVISDVILIGARQAELRLMMRGRWYGRLCLLKEQEWEGCAGLLAAPWREAAENNLLIPTKCV